MEKFDSQEDSSFNQRQKSSKSRPQSRLVPKNTITHYLRTHVDPKRERELCKVPFSSLFFQKMGGRGNKERRRRET